MANRRRPSEEDVRIRPARSTRPRTKDRPDYRAATEGFVLTVDRGRITALAGDRIITAMKARELGKNAVVAGDLVSLVGDLSGSEGSLARVVEVRTRKNSVSRTIDIGSEKVIAANIDQMLIVSASASPEPKQGFIDRCLVVAYDQGIKPIIVMTKRDLADPSDFLSVYRPLEVESFVLSRDSDLSAIQNTLRGKTSVLIGHSGVGKSTLVNNLSSDEKRSVGKVNVVTGRGRHTSSSAIAMQLPAGGWIIDTPGVRSFGLEHVEESRVIGAFPELNRAIASCPKNCHHRSDGCGLDKLIETHPESIARVESLRRLLNSQDNALA